MSEFLFVCTLNRAPASVRKSRALVPPDPENKRKHTILMGLFTFPNAPGMTGLHLGYPFLLCVLVNNDDATIFKQ